jgi:hypothetical protein
MTTPPDPCFPINDMPLAPAGYNAVGISRRGLVAALVAAALAGAVAGGTGPFDPRQIALAALQVADALLAELDK